jgi:RNA polymerase sigma factor (TIGR02999 family)
VTPATRGDITKLLHAWRAGDEQAQDELWQVVYGELRQLARHVLYSKGGKRRHQPTSLVHLAYLRLLGADVEWTDRRHFLAVAARAMRFVLADEARQQLTRKHGRPPAPLGARLDEVADPLARRPEEVVAVHQALHRLAKIHPRHERLVELRYFAGLTVNEAAEVLEVNPRTVVRDWKSVRHWLYCALKSEPA